MDYSDEELDDLKRLHALREQLRAMAEETVAAMRDLPKPKTWAEAGSKLRTVAAADRVVTGMFSPPRRTRKPRTPSAPKPRPPKPEPSPFMQSMDDIERSLKQIIGVKTALDDVPGDMEVPANLSEALSEVSKQPPGTPLSEQAMALARLSRETTLATAKQKLMAAFPDLMPKPPP